MRSSGTSDGDAWSSNSRKALPSQLEPLEERLLLSVVAAPLPGMDILMTLIRPGLEAAIQAIPQEARETLPGMLREGKFNLLGSFSYHALPGETNNITVSSTLANGVLMINEAADIIVIRVPPVFTSSFLTDLKLGANAKGEGGASLVGHLAGGLGITIEGIDGIFKQIVKLPEATALAMNGMAIIDMVPVLNDIVDTFNSILDFNLADFIQDDMVILPPVKLPDWVPLVGGVTVFPGWSFAVPAFVGELFTSLPTSLRELIDVLPAPVGGFFSVIEGVLSYVETSFASSGVLIDLLDGNNRVDFSTLTGVGQEAYGGPGNDTFLIGGGQNFFSVSGIGLYDNATPAVIQLYGGPGDDTFVLNRNFDNLDLRLYGGPGIDTVTIPAPVADDIIRVVAGPDGTVARITFERLNANAGATANEVQIIALPHDTVGGTFTLEAKGLGVTAPIAHNASADQLKAALMALGVNDADLAVEVSGGGWMITFQGALGNRDLPPLRGNGEGLLRRGVELAVTVTREADGSTGVDEVQRVALPSQTTGGHFKLRLPGYAETAPIEWNAGSAAVKDALVATGIAAADIRVTGGSGVWWITFTGGMGATDVDDLIADGSLLTGGITVPVTATGSIKAVNEIHVIDAIGATGGAFVLRHNDGFTTRDTAALTHHATSLEVQQALEALGTIGQGNVKVTGTAGGPYSVEFIGALAGVGPQELAVLTTGLTGASAVTLTHGGGGSNEVQRVTVPAIAGGSFSLTFAGETTAAISQTAAAGAVKAALEALPAIDQVIVTSAAAGQYDIEFTGTLADVDVPGLQVAIVVGASQTQAPAPAQPQGFTIDLPAEVIGGSFRIVLTDGASTQYTNGVVYHATAAAVQAALEGLPMVGAGGAAVVKTATGWEVTFTGAAADKSLAMTVDPGRLRGALTHSITVTELASGSGTNEIQQVRLPLATAGGTFRLGFDGMTTEAIAWNADGAAVRDALIAAGLPAADVQVYGGAQGPWDIEFTGGRAAADQPLITIDGTDILYTGGAIDVAEHVKGNDGKETVVLRTTEFTAFEDIERLVITGGPGNDHLIIDNSAGPITLQGGIIYNGADGQNRVTFIGAEDNPASSTSHSAGKSEMVFATGTQTVFRTSADVYDLTPVSGAMSIVGGAQGEQIELLAAGNLARVNLGSLTIHFSDKADVVISSQAGDDTIWLGLAHLPSWLTGVAVHGGTSAGRDTLMVSGTDYGDQFSFTPTGAGHGSMTAVTDGVARGIDIRNVDSFSLSGGGHGQQPNSLVYSANGAFLTPSTFPAAGVAAGVDLMGYPLLKLEYDSIQHVSVVTGGVYVIEGTPGNDVVAVENNQVVITNLLDGRNVIDVSGVNALILNLQGGSDQVTIGEGNHFPHGILIDGGDSADRVIVHGGAGNVEIDLATGRIDGVAGGVQLYRVEELTLAMGDADLQITELGAASQLQRVTVQSHAPDLGRVDILTTDRPQEVLYRPLGPGLGEVAGGGASTLIVLEGLGSSALRLHGDASVVSAVIEATGGNEDILLTAGLSGTRVAVSPAGVPWLPVELRGFAFLSIQGGGGNDTLTVDNSTGLLPLPGGVYFHGGVGEDAVVLTGSLPIDLAEYTPGPYVDEARVTHTAGMATQTVRFRGVGSVADLTAGDLTVYGTNVDDVISYTPSPRSASAEVGYASTGQIAVNTFPVIEFGNKTTLTILGLAGNDWIDLGGLPMPEGLETVILNGGPGNDVLIGSDGDDILLGGPGDDRLYGMGGNDRLDGGPGNDLLHGGEGNNTFRAGRGNDVIVGGNGQNALRVLGDNGDDDVDVDAGTVLLNDQVITMTGLAELSVETLAGPDRITLTARTGIPARVLIASGDDDDDITVNLVNPAPPVDILIDGGGYTLGNRCVITGLVGADQFEVFNPIFFFGQALMEVDNIQDLAVLEGLRIDRNSSTLEPASFTFADADGNLTSVELSGPGYAEVYRNIVNGRNADIDTIILNETSEALTTLIVNVRPRPGTDDKTSIGSIQGSGLRAIGAVNSNLLTGLDLDGGLRLLRIHGIEDNARLETAGPSGMLFRLQAGDVGNVTLQTTQVVDLSVASWMGGKVVGSWLRRIETRQGDFRGELVNTLQNPRGIGLGNLTVNGGDLIAVAHTDRIGNVLVRGGDAHLTVNISADAQAMPHNVAVRSITVRGGDLLGLLVNCQSHTAVGALHVQQRGGVGGNVLGDIRIGGGLNHTRIDGNALGGEIAAAYFGSIGLGGALIADVTAYGADSRGRSIRRLVVGSVGDVDLTVPGGIGTLRAADWAGGDIRADWIYTLSITGNPRQGLVGDFGANITLAGTFGRGISLHSFSVAGTADGAGVRTVGSMGRVRVGATVGSDFLAGLDGSVARQPSSANDFVNPGASIRFFAVHGIRGQEERFFTDTNIAAAAIGNVGIRNGDWDTGDSGIFASSASDRPIRSVRHRDIDANLNWSWPGRPDRLFAGPDELIRIL